VTAGLVSPIIIQFNYEDGSSEIDRIGAYVWRKNEKEVTKTFLRTKKIASIYINRTGFPTYPWFTFYRIGIGQNELERSPQCMSSPRAMKQNYF